MGSDIGNCSKVAEAYQGVRMGTGANTLVETYVQKAAESGDACSIFEPRSSNPNKVVQLGTVDMGKIKRGERSLDGYQAFLANDATDYEVLVAYRYYMSKPHFHNKPEIGLLANELLSRGFDPVNVTIALDEGYRAARFREYYSGN